MNLNLTRFKSGPLLAALAIAGISAGSARAAIVVTGSATFNPVTSLYSYSYSVSNTDLVEDGILVTIPVNPASALIGIQAPTGFSLTFDPSQGWVNFMEDGNIVTPQTFAPASTVAPFQFDSPLAPVFVTYLAYDSAGTEFSGSVQAPVPEPTGALLCGLSTLPLLLRRRR